MIAKIAKQKNVFSSMRILLAQFLLCSFTVAAFAQEHSTTTAPLKLIDGIITGVIVDAEKNVRAYKGIPFAAPPVGDLRWRPPQPARPWQGIRRCATFSPACPQPSAKALFLCMRQASRMRIVCI